MSYKNTVPNLSVLNSGALPQTNATVLSTFDLSETLHTTMDFDYIYPVYWREMNPNDHYSVSIQGFSRLMPLVAPIMSNIRVKYYAFFVPNRLIWKHWSNFMGGKTYQNDKTDYTVPRFTIGSSKNESCSVADYLGIPPTGLDVDVEVSAFPFRAYNKIWNDWFRAKELQDYVTEFSGDYKEENEGLYSYPLLKKCKAFDFFTSCLPQPQAGSPVVIPLSGDAVVRNREGVSTKINISDKSILQNTFSDLGFNSGSDKALYVQKIGSNLGGQDTGLYADMSNVTGVSIESLRKAAALQVLLERDARAGETYIDLMNEHFAVQVPDFLVGRSQFLGSVTDLLSVEPIAQQSESGTTPQGNLSAVGVSQINKHLAEYSTVEHGIFMIMACVEGENLYQQGIDRKFSKVDRFDYMFPEFWNLGDEVVKNKEIFLSKDKAVNEQVFGYIDRYREYRQGVNRITGKMRSNVGIYKVPGSLDVWHLGQKFENLPKLNSEFIQQHTPIERALAVPDEPDLVFTIKIDVKATSNLPVQSNPSLLVGRV